MRFPVALILLSAVPIAIAIQHDSDADVSKASLSAKQLAVGTLMYTEDTDDMMPFNVGQVGAVYPYVANLGTFLPFPAEKPSMVYKMAPMAKGEKTILVPSAFVFNPFLYGKVTTHWSPKITAETVFWSYGSQKHLSFAFQGKTLVAFVNGHTKFVIRSEAKKLRWKP